MGAMNPITEQEFYRIRDDTTGADPGTPNWISTQNQSTRTNIDVSAGDDTIRIRFVVANTGTANENNQFELYVNKNSTSYARVETSGTVGVLLSTAASSSADNTTLTTSNFQLSAGTGTAVDGQYDDGATDVGVATNLPNDDYFELEFGLNCVQADLNDGDTFDFRVYAGGSPFNTYDTNATAIIDITKGGITYEGTGTCAFDVDSSGAATRSVGAATGTAAFDIDATGDGTRYAKGDGTAAFEIDMSGNATVSSGTTYEGTGTAAFVVDMSGDALGLRPATGTAAFDIDASGAATRTVGAASGTSAFDIDMSGDGSIIRFGSGTTAFTVLASADATIYKLGAGTASFDIDMVGEAAANLQATGTAALTVTMTGNATIPGAVTSSAQGPMRRRRRKQPLAPPKRIIGIRPRIPPNG